MNIDNITSDSMTLNYNGKATLIKAYEQEIERLNNDYLEMKDNFRVANDEIERLNNIINELEKVLKDHKQIKTKAHYGEYYVEVEEVLDYLQKLKGENNEKN